MTDVEKLITKCVIKMYFNFDALMGFLFSLWSSLVCEYAYLAKAAVALLCDCLEFLAIPADVQAKDMDLQQTKFRSIVDSKFEQDSHTKRFEVGMHLCMCALKN